MRGAFIQVCSSILLQASHLALLDGLMTAHAASIVTVERVVKSVR